MNLSHTLRELFWENPMTLEATRTLRYGLRTGNNGGNPYATRSLNRFLVGTLGFLYLWMMLGIVRSKEDISPFLLMGELFLLTLFVPCSLYGAIAVEREKQTYESLIMTRLTPAQIVCGKLWWRVGVIAALMALFVPLLIVSHQSGQRPETSFTAQQLVWSQVQIFVWSVFVGAFSLWVSARSKKGITALLGIVATLLGFLALVPLLISLFRGFDQYISLYDPLRLSRNDHGLQLLMSHLFVALNPFTMVAGLFGERHYSTDPCNTGNEWSCNLSPYQFWQFYGANYWGVAVFAVLAVLLIRASIKILRGLEMPVAEKVRRSRVAFALPKGDV